MEYIRLNCFQSEHELRSGKCTNESFDTRLVEIIDTLLDNNNVDDFQLADIPKKLQRFYLLLQKEKKMLLSNRNWALDNRYSQY